MSPLSARLPATLPRLALSNDLVFKALFSRWPHLLSDLINAVRHPAPPIAIARILNPHVLADDPAGKRVEFDILAQDTEGGLYVVEMQARWQAHWPARNVYYVARGLAGQLRAGQGYEELRPSIGISLLGQNWDAGASDQADWHFSVRDARRPSIEFGNELHWHLVELPKADMLATGSPQFQAWVACLRHNLNEEVMNQITHPPVREALFHLESMCSDEELRIRAMLREMARMDHQAELKAARDEGREEGIERGIERGIEQGIEQGIERGIEQGIEQGRVHALREVLERQVVHRFGALSPAARDTLQNAPADVLSAWTLNLFEATSIEQLFGQTPPGTASH
ncbi:Rpn family recombination-promoting nuclease/putative transposase [Bordetella genomosp. 13]|uniref:Rpn family recombination-promoting nuclease/putative transposase n=1 Tax=Bordetella genomosp. 13 TaxID=463040 RepID=UPI0012F73F7C|nr:Rpn family recombination-promoting nuclease/putative transposase [Bordetella genomosp. 13]